jgi:hypothetical protein
MCNFTLKVPFTSVSSFNQVGRKSQYVVFHGLKPTMKINKFAYFLIHLHFEISKIIYCKVMLVRGLFSKCLKISNLTSADNLRMSAGCPRTSINFLLKRIVL